MRLGEKLQKLRGGKSNAAIALACGCSTANIQKIIREGSTPNFALGVRLAKELGVPADWLADDGQDWPPPASVGQAAEDLVSAALAGAGLAGDLAQADDESAAAWEARLKAAGRWPDVLAWRRSHHWFPHQLRHVAGTRIQRAFGREAAKEVLRHADLRTTEIYVDPDKDLARRVAAAMG